MACALGLILLAAGTIKAWQLIADPHAPSDLSPSPSLRAAAVNAEFVLGLWLLVGVYPRTARLVAVGCFALFLAIATRQVLAGKMSCGCFGAVAVAPWLMAAFDLGAICALIGFPPPPSHPTSRSRRAALVAAVVALGVGVPVTLAILQSGGYPRLDVNPEVLAFGAVESGETARSDFVVFNTGPETVEIASVETSCHCLVVRLPVQFVGAGSSVVGEAILDMSLDPSFTGNLSVRVDGRDASGRTVFTLLVEASVR